MHHADLEEPPDRLNVTGLNVEITNLADPLTLQRLDTRAKVRLD
jgi:hypothetical protein